MSSSTHESLALIEPFSPFLYSRLPRLIRDELSIKTGCGGVIRPFMTILFFLIFVSHDRIVPGLLYTIHYILYTIDKLSFWGWFQAVKGWSLLTRPRDSVHHREHFSMGGRCVGCSIGIVPL